MKTIHHYSLDVGQDSVIWLPVGSDIKHFGARDGVLTIWIEKPLHELSQMALTVQIFGTGWDIPENYKYVQTMQSGQYVWHLYKREN